MSKPSGANVVIQGGTAEAKRLADMLPHAQFIRAIDTRGGPENAGALTAEALRQTGASLLVDACHPFDIASHYRAVRAADSVGISYVRLLRPAWTQSPRDHWVQIDRACSLRYVVQNRARLFAATGREELNAFKPLYAHVFWRSVGDERVTLPLRNSHVLPAEGPFTVEGEMALFRKLRIDWLVVRNAGGQGAWPKIEAARRLGLQVAMIDRPKPLKGPVLGSVNEVMEWIEKTQ